MQYVASSFAEMIGFSANDLLGKKLFSLFSTRYSKNLSIQLNRISPADRITFQTHVKHKSGKGVPVDFYRIPFPVNQSYHYLYLAPANGFPSDLKNELPPVKDSPDQYERDNSKAEIQSPRHTGLLNLMNELQTDWPHPFRWSVILRQLKKAIYFDKAILYTYNEVLRTFHCEASSGLSKKEIRNSEKTACSGSPAKAIENGEPLLEYILLSYSNKNAIIDLNRTQSCLTVPLKIEDQKIGVLELKTSQKPGYQQSDMDIISVFTTYLASLLLNHQLIPKTSDLTKYKRLFSKVNIPVFYCKRSGRIIECNQAFQDLFGFSTKKQALKSNLFHHIQLYTNGRKTFHQLISKCGFFINLEVQLKNNRKTRHVLISIAPIKDNQSQIIGYEGTLQDISEKRKQKEQLIQAQKLISLGSLAGGIIHDFNNLLGGIMGCASLIMGEMSKRNRYYQDVETIFNASRKATELTSDMLSFSRKDKHQIKVVSVNDIVSEVIRILSRTIDKNVAIKLNLYPDVTPIEVDTGRIQQTLMNICINARDAMPAGGDLIIETTNAIVDRPFNEPHIKIDPGAYVVIKVSDTGLGIDPKTMHKIFEPFFTTKTKKHGSGLGLAIANEIVKNHKGGIQVESEFGEGTTFTIYLPASSADVEQSVTIPSIISLPKGSETILLVDDEELIRDMGKRMLEKFGYKVLVAHDGLEALEIYKKEGKHIDVLILDIIMPKMDGIKTFMEVRKLNPGARVLLATGSILNGKEAKLRKQGVAGLLQKPFLASQILKTVRQTLD